MVLIFGNTVVCRLGPYYCLGEENNLSENKK